MKILIIFCFVFISLSFANFHLFSHKIRRRSRNLEDGSNLFEADSNPIDHDREPITEKSFDYHAYVRDFLQFTNDTNGKIEGKIIDELKRIPSNFKNLKPIILSTDGYSFAKPTMKFHSDQKDVIFHNVTLSQWYDSDYDRKRFSILLGCESSTNSKIKIELPTNLQIAANLSVTNPTTGSTNQGSITVVIRNGTLLKHITTLSDDEFGETFRKISFTNSKIDIQSDAAAEILIDTEILGAFFNEIEFSLREFFANQLNEKMDKQNVQLAAICSRPTFNSTDRIQAIKLHQLSLLVRNIFNLYIIPSSKTETWKGITLNVGPIVMNGFLHFNNSEFFVSREYSYTKLLSSRIKITNLKGKFECNLDFNNIAGNSSTVFSFTSDYILLSNSYSVAEHWSASWNQDVEVYVGETRIIRNKLFKSTSEGYEMQFMDYVLAEHLKSAIAESLRTSLKEKIRDTDFSFLESFFNDD